MRWFLFIIAIGFVGALLSLFKRAPESRGDRLGAADRASAKLITKEVADGFRSGLRQSSDAELSSLMAEGARLHKRLEELEKVLAVRYEPALLANVRIDLRQIRVRLEWMEQERVRRAAGSLVQEPA